MKFLDLFSGIGGFRLGLERSGHTPVGYVEIDKFARQSYQAMYNTGGEWTAEDINKVTDEEWRKFNGTVELIAGGFPCQSFSIAGKREGFLNQTKGTLFFEVARAVKQIKPRFVFLENVKGLLNHDKGNTFRTILNTLDELGYDVEWRVYNSKDFGVPQNRERVYIIGHLRGDSGREVFPFFGEDGEVNQSTIKQIGNVSTGKMLENNSQSGRVYSLDSLAPTISAAMGMGGGRVPLINPVTINDLTRPENPRHGKRGNVLGTDGISSAITATDYKLPKQIMVKVKDNTKKGYDTATVGDSINISQPNSKTRRGRVGHGIANTLVTGSEQATLTNEYRIRKLTPRECWRLQAFPDELFDKAQQAGLSDSQLYKQAGNSVTVNVIEYIGNLLKERE
ncbi:MAG: hypothetical protein [Bacteriophage sp.]|nr:MAG: hypothetical protein [Bacteriophage sp.]